MILADSSAWVELLLATESPIHRRLRQLLRSGGEVATTEPVVLEVLAGERPGRDLQALRERLLDLPMLSIGGLDAYEEAAAIYRACRAGGETPRTLMDCLIAVPALREDIEILHAHTDFDLIARHTRLRVHRPE